MNRTRLVALAASTVALLAIGPTAGASAYAPVKNGNYEGKTAEGNKVTLKVSKNGKRFKAGSRINFTFTCNDGSKGDDYIGIAGFPILGNGDFSQPDFTDTDEQGTTVELTLSGKFKSRGKKVSGAMSFKVSGKNPNTGADFSCESGEVPFSASLKKKKK